MVEEQTLSSLLVVGLNVWKHFLAAKPCVGPSFRTPRRVAHALSWLFDIQIRI